MKNLKFVTQLRELLEQKSQHISEIEMTPGNYSDRGALISEKIPTITTYFCEIGAYDDICYFVIILKYRAFTKDFFELISVYPNFKIYGFNNFLETYYPKDDFSYEKLEEQIKSEDLMQIQFNFSTTELTPELLKSNYFEVKALFEKNNVIVENQLIEDFTADRWHK